MTDSNSGSEGPVVEASTAGIPPDDSRDEAAMEGFLHLLRSGVPSPTEFLAGRVAIADVLAGCLEGLEVVPPDGGGRAPSGPGSAIDEVLTPSTRLGDFQIIREVGRGGMGVVYEAEQVPLGRRVALKVLPSAASLDPRHRQRFQVEAQAAALLHHEHIVPVFGFGCDRGVHYYAMQFIDGRSLADLIRDHRSGLLGNGLPGSMPSAGQAPHGLPPAPGPDSAAVDGSDPRGDVTVLLESAAYPPPKRLGPHGSSHSARGRQRVRTAAQLGLQAAEAIEHAHAIGVIHRDIKPSNLLIDARGHLWVTDFGLARIAQDDPGLTRTGDLVGTLRYMSPEQVRGDRVAIDPRVDVYALGVTLYELLTSRAAFHAQSRQALLHRILHDEPVAPRRIDPAIPRDMETIVLKAMAKEPMARYGSARELGDDLRRFLGDQPIRARRPGTLERAVKWSRRHRATVVTAATVLLLTLSVSTALLWQAKRRTDAALASLLQAQHQTEAVLESRRRAGIDERKALELSLGVFDQIIDQLPSPADGAGPPAKPEAAPIYRNALAFYANIARMFAEDEKMREVSAKAYRRAGHCRAVLGDPKARADYRRAIDLYEHMAADHPGWIWLRTGLIEALQEYADKVAVLGDATEAEAFTRRAVQVAEGLIGNKAAASPCFCKALIDPFNDLAWRLVEGPQARSDVTASAIRLALQATEWEPDQTASWNTLGLAYYRAGDWASAVAAVERAMGLNDGSNAIDWFLLAAIRHRQGDSERARECYYRALSRLRLDQSPDRDSKLRRIRDEAAQVLGRRPARRDEARAPIGVEAGKGATLEKTGMREFGGE